MQFLCRDAVSPGGIAQVRVWEEAGTGELPLLESHCTLIGNGCYALQGNNLFIFLNMKAI